MAFRKEKKRAAPPTAPHPSRAAPAAALSAREALLAAAIALAGSALWVAPVFSGWHRWGVNDWDQHQMFYGVPRWSILERGEAPFWNPFMCGGNAMLADPQSPFLNPLFGVVLLLGVVPGLKILVWLHAALSLFGTWLFARRMEAGRISAWLAAAAYGLSSAYALHVATGHSTWFAMGYVPLGLCALHEGFERAERSGGLPAGLRWGAVGGVAVAMTLFIGNAYLFAYLGLFAGLWAALEAVRRRSWRPVAGAAAMGVSGAGLAAVKILPVADFMKRVTTPEVPDRSSGDLSLLWQSLVGRAQDLSAHAPDIHVGDPGLPAMVWRWWEYGAYVGPVVLVLGLGFFATHPRRAWPMAGVTLVAILLALGNGWGVWDLLRQLPVFEGLRVPSRAIIAAVLFLGLAASLWVTEWELRLSHRASALALGVFLVALDIGYVGRSAFHQAFGMEPVAGIQPGPFRQGFGKKDFRGAYNRATGRYDAAYSDMYPAFLANKGVVNCYNRLHLPIAVQPAEIPGRGRNPEYRGEAWLAAGGSAEIRALGGRRIVVAVAPLAPGLLVVNQNHDPGWRAVDGRPVRAERGLIAVEVTPADREVVLEYTPPGLWLGLSVSVATLAACAALPLWGRLRRRVALSASTAAPAPRAA